MQEIIVPLIIAPHCLSIALLAIIRIKNITQKKSIIFILLSAWSLSPLINPFFRAYGWILGICLVYIAIIYTLIITFPKLIKFMIIYFFTSVFLTIFLNKSDAELLSFTIKFITTIFMNVILFIYYFKHKTKFHLLLGFMSSIMILGGLYQSLSTLFKWIVIPANAIGD